MNSKLVNVMMFAAGAVIGTAATWKYWKTKYEKIVQEEIESVKEAFSKKQADEDTKPKDVEENDDEEEDELQTYSEEEIGEYIDTASLYSESNGLDILEIIPPEEHGEREDYTQFNLTYYSDGVLCDENDEPVEDVEGLVGVESLDHFGEYEDDSVHVRNHRLKCDCEILYSQKKYSDVINRKPHQVED